MWAAGPTPGALAEVAAEGGTPALSAEILRVELDAKDNAAHFVIKISSSSDGYNSYMLKRRYKQFDGLHASLKARYNGLPELPGKSFTLLTGGGEAEKAENRRLPLTGYLRTLLADPVLAKSDEVASFLELSSALDLFAKLHKKDVMHAALMTAKDEELEHMRSRLATVSSDRSSAQAQASLLREAVQEGELARQQLREQLRAAEDRLAGEERRSEKAAALLADASAAADHAERKAASLQQSLQQAHEEEAAAAAAAAAAAEAAATARVADLSEQLVMADRHANELRQELVTQRAATEAAEERLSALHDRLAATEAAITANATDIETRYAAAVSELASARTEIGELQSAATATSALCQSAQAEAAELRAALQLANAAVSEAEVARAEREVAHVEAVELWKRRAEGSDDPAARFEGAAATQVVPASEGPWSDISISSETAAQLAAAETRVKELSALLAIAEGREKELVDLLASAEAREKELRDMLTMERAATAEQMNAISQKCMAEQANAATGPISGHARHDTDSLPTLPTLPTPAQALSSYTVAVPSANEGTPSGRYRWLYTLCVTCGAVTYTIPKRYSEVKALHKRLAASSLHLPRLPPAHAFATQDAQFAEKRRAELATYFDELLCLPTLRGSSELASFLELGVLLRRSMA